MNVLGLSKRLTFLASFVLVAAFMVASLQAAQPAATTPPAGAQLKCPVTPKEDVDPAVFTEYQGQQVFFCCVRCKNKFLAEPQKYVAELTAFDAGKLPPSEQAHAPAVEADHDEGTHEHAEADHDHASEAAPGMSHSTDDHEGHEHQHGDSQTPRIVAWFGNFHPAMTDFPIGVLVAAAVAEVLFAWRTNQMFANAARFAVWFAALTGILAAVLGWCFGGFRLVDSNPILMVHRWLGTATAIWLVFLLWSSERMYRPAINVGRHRGLYRAMLFIGTVLVLVTGFFGGAMVYGLSHYWS